jgi:hypothetical protein
MRRLIWPVLVWLLALAVPLQGLAAATMLHCAPLRGDAAPQAAHNHDHHVSSAALPHASASKDHDAHHASASHHGHDGDDTSPVHTCSACATCNVGIGLPSTPTPLAEPTAATALLPALASVHAAFLTSAPERPPRASAA